MMAQRHKLEQAIHEMQEHLQLSGSPEADEDEAIESLMQDCGKLRDGSCSLAGSEYCDFECAFREEP